VGGCHHHHVAVATGHRVPEEVNSADRPPRLERLVDVVEQTVGNSDMTCQHPPKQTQPNPILSLISVA
jgi:hypothetical protein